jgi:hypothetical protein
LLKDVKIELARRINIFPEPIQNLDSESIDARSMLTAVVARGLNQKYKDKSSAFKNRKCKDF